MKVQPVWFGEFGSTDVSDEANSVHVMRISKQCSNNGRAAYWKDESILTDCRQLCFPFVPKNGFICWVLGASGLLLLERYRHVAASLSWHSKQTQKGEDRQILPFGRGIHCSTALVSLLLVFFSFAYVSRKVFQRLRHRASEEKQ